MTTIIHGVRAGWKAAAFAAAVAIGVAGAPQSGSAQDALTWEPVSAEVGVGDSVRVAVRLEDASGLVTLAPDAVSEARIDMGPDGMAMMAAPLRPVPAAEGESLAWETDLAMGGRWALTVTAAVPGHAEPVTGEVVITAARQDQ